MNLSKFDVVIVTTMTLSIVLMSLMFPALGLTAEADTGNESEVPEYNTSASGFDIVGEFPEQPGTPSKFSLTFDNDAQGNGDNTLFLDGDSTSGTEITLTKNETNFNQYSSGSLVGKDTFTTDSEGTLFTYSNASYVIEGEVTNYTQQGNEFTVKFNVNEQPKDEGFLSRIPVVGGVISAGNQLASIVGWIGSIIYWLFGALVETSIAIVTQLLSVIVFFVDMLVWLTTTYTGIVSAAGSWASFVLVVPAVLLFLEFAKLIAVGISLLPTT